MYTTHYTYSSAQVTHTSQPYTRPLTVPGPKKHPKERFPPLVRTCPGTAGGSCLHYMY